jgi:thiol-disulfide isomerase/thioredoxin
MRSRILRLSVLALPLLILPCNIVAQEPTTATSSESLIEQIVKAKDQRSFYPAYSELGQRIEKGGAKGDATAQSVLAHRQEISPEVYVKAMVDGLVEQNKFPLAANLLLQIAKAKATVSSYKKGSVVVGRVVVGDGKLDPELVLAQMEILPEGYFAGEVGDLERPVGFRAEGYLGVDVPLKGKSGDVVDLGTITVQPLPSDQAATLKGSVTLDDAKGASSTSIKLSMSVPRANTPHNGYSPRHRWPEAKSIAVSQSGEFQLDGLTPGDHTIIVEADGHERFMKRVTLSSGPQKEPCAIKLRTNDIGFYLGKSAPKVGALAWEKDYPTALKKAQAEKKPMMVMMTATWCGPCKALEKETLNDPWIRHFLSKFVIVQAFEDKDVEGKYGSNGYPTLVFTDSQGKEAARTVGHQATLPFAGVCAKAFKALGEKAPSELDELTAKKVLPPVR